MTTQLAPQPVAASAVADTQACDRCGISGRYPGITFDASGVCDLCAMYEAKGQDILSYFGDVDAFVRLVRARAEERGSDYDCLLLYSGGKDSSYVLYRLIELGLRVRTFTFDNGFISKTALRNVDTITSDLGIQHVTATHADQNKVFLKSLQQHKSVCNGCFRSLLDLSTQHAHDLGIPTIVTGLSRGQIMDERLTWFHQQGIFDPAEIEPALKAGRSAYHQSGGAIGAEAVDSVEVVDYYRYSDVTKDGIRALLKSRSDLWSQPGDTGFCSSNCMINDAGVLVHTRERGFHNYEAPTRWEVRLGHLERTEADEELQEPAATPRVKKMLLQIGYPLPEAGTPVTPAEAPGAERTSVAPSAPQKREAALTPAQHEVLVQGAAEPGLQGRALLLEAADGADSGRVRRAALQLLLHHEALRLRFTPQNGVWRQYDAGVAGALPVLRLDLSAREPAQEAEALGTAVERLRSRLSLTDGPLLQIALVDRGPRPARLLLVVHELLADTASWRVLLRDLCTLWAAPEGRAQLPAAGSFLERAAALAGEPAAGGPELSGPADDAAADAEAPVRIRRRVGAPVSAAEVARALSQTLASLGDVAQIDVVDHTAGDGQDGIGRWTLTESVTSVPEPASDTASDTASETASDAKALIRYEHFGDLTGLLPPDAPLAVVEADGVDFTVLPSTGRDTVTVNGVVRDGILYLEWWSSPSRRNRLLAAALPERVARRLARSAEPGTR
ncbi:condensation domain-containing protein [Streptomyces sp. NPDC059431]|uniref:condensation domain-containing protein n=1 Tax=Streptomyces sp. NPDC059431 TaxID=3346828 RepID=UPI0036C0A22E